MADELDELDLLVSSLSSAVTALQKSLKARKLSSNNAKEPTQPDRTADDLPDPVSWYARKAVIALCRQIIEEVQNPQERSLIDGQGFLVTAAMGVVCNGSPSLAQLVSKAEDEGVEISALAKETGMNQTKLRSILRPLIVLGYFKEIKSGYIAHTKLTGTLVPGHGALPELIVLWRKCMAACSILPECMSSEPKTGDPAVFEAYHKVPVFAWVQSEPGQLSHFHNGMTQLEHLDTGIFVDYPWETLGEHITFVDIGAGHGETALALLKKHTGWRAVLHDRPEVVADAQKVWEEHAPEIIQSDRVTMVGHSFFEATPLKPAPADHPYVFMFKSVLHNWTDDVCVKILHTFDAAVSRGSILLLVNPTPGSIDASNLARKTVAEYFTAIDGKSMQDIHEMDVGHIDPIGLDWGYGNTYVSNLDALMFTLMNARSRSTDGWEQILRDASWKLVSKTDLRGVCSVIRAVKL